jgi:Bacterial archaeo-eukaryotic release factor family 2
VNSASLRPIFDAEGPYVTVHMEVGRDTEDAPQQLDARWTTVRHRLEDEQVEPKLVTAIGERLQENTHAPGEVRRTIVGTGTEIVFDDVQIGHSIRPEVTEIEVLPDLSGWLALEDRAIPFVLVVADREGADIDVHRALSRAPVDREAVQGETFHITKVPQGDWAQKQFQQNAENAWHRNAGQVAEAVRSLQRRHRPRLVMVAGDVRARADIADQIAAPDVTVVKIESGGRAAGASQEALWSEVEHVLAATAAAVDKELSDRLDQARGQGSGAAHGLEAVLDALVQSRVEQLVLDLHAATEKSVRPRDHEGLPLPAATPADQDLPADRVLVAAATLSGAEIRLLPESLAHGGGVAAVLRWED